MLRGARKYWLIAIIFGIIVTGLFYVYLQQIKSAYIPRDLVQVVKASQDIPKDTVINVNSIVVEQVPAQYAHKDALRDKSAVVGKIATGNIAAGEQILNQNLLGASDEQKRMAYSIPEGKRAISVAVTSVSGVSGYIQAGDHVDVVSVVDLKSTDNSAAPYSVVVLQNIAVLAVGDNSALNTEKKTTETAKTITLAVSVQEAQRLTLAVEKGAIRLLLRSPVEKGTVTQTPFQLQDFLK